MTAPLSPSSSSDRDESRQQPAPHQEVEARRRAEGPLRRGFEDADGGRSSGSWGRGRGSARRRRRRSSGNSSGRRCCRRRRRRHRGGSFLPAASSLQRPRLPLARGSDRAQRHHGDAQQNQLQHLLGLDAARRGAQGARRRASSLAEGRSRRPRGPRGARRRRLPRGAEPVAGLAGLFGEGGLAARGVVAGAGGEGAEARGEGNGRRRRRSWRRKRNVVFGDDGGRVGRGLLGRLARHRRRRRRGCGRRRCLRLCGLRGAYRRPCFVPRLRRRRIKLSSVSWRFRVGGFGEEREGEKKERGEGKSMASTTTTKKKNESGKKKFSPCFFSHSRRQLRRGRRSQSRLYHLRTLWSGLVVERGGTKREERKMQVDGDVFFLLVGKNGFFSHTTV